MVKRVPAQDFTVGWVCALPIELAAAVEIMDDEFADLPSHPADPNVYSLGQISSHKVVVACLPAGQTGTSQAAVVASWMRLSFPSLRFGVLVGMGGGVPRLDQDVDIRLGDVVISQPTGQHGGVVQYDFGKTGPDGRIARTGSLNTPPTILLNALAKLRANHLRGKTHVLAHLAKLSSQLKFASPGPDQDTLYDASSAHITGATCLQCRAEDVLHREVRPTTEPALFFGTIASGNQKMGDGPTRDRYSQELGGVLCFDMEAAGLMNDFPCLAVRGICNYADAHKNVRWQPYAAATAAAYTKELLSIVPPLALSHPDGPNNSRQTSHFLVQFGRNEDFVGREGVLKQILKRVPPSSNQDTCQRTVIEGLGGIGKTQVAIESAYRIREAHPDCSVFWVPAISVPVFDNAYRDIGRALGVPGIEDDQADVKNLVKAALSRDKAGQWLLIIDNADDTLLFTDGKLLSCLPFSRQGSILVTTRSHKAAVRFRARHGVIRLVEPSASEARQLLHQDLEPSQMSDDQATAELLGYLSYLPLAVRQASAFLASNINITISRYLGYCKSSDEMMVKMLSTDFDDQDRYEEAQNPVATTWLISFHHISRDTPLAADYLGFICCLAEKNIPVSLLPPGEDEMKRDEAIGTLKAYAFIMDGGAPDRFDIHRLVRLITRKWLQGQNERDRQKTRVIARLADEFPPPKHDNRDIWAAYLPHAETALAFEGQCAAHKASIYLLSAVGNCCRLLGRYVEAGRMYRQTLELSENVLGLEHHTTLATRNCLADILRNQGKYTETREAHYQTLGSIERAGVPAGMTHLALDSMDNLARMFHSLGNHHKAEGIHREISRFRENLLGREHPQTLSSKSNFAETLRSQEKYEEAEKMHRQISQIREKVLGREHPETLSSMSNVAETLRGQGNYTEAEEKHREVLALRQGVLGLEHPQTLNSESNLAETLWSQEKYEEAEQMHRRISQLREKILGREHPDTLASLDNLGRVLQSQARYEEAEQVFQRTLELGAKPPDVLGNGDKMAWELASRGQYEAAEQIHRKALELKEEVLGPVHPSILVSFNGLAEVLEKQGKYEEAELVHSQALAWSEKALGRNHPMTIRRRERQAFVTKQASPDEQTDR